MKELITQLAHGGASILAAVAFLVFFLTQIWKSVHVEASFGEFKEKVKQPKQEWLLLLFIAIMGVVVDVKLLQEIQSPGDTMPESYVKVLIGAILLVTGLIIFIIIRTISPTKFFTNGILIHDYGFVKWTDIKQVDKLPKGQYRLTLLKGKNFRGKTCFVRYDASQEEVLTDLFKEYVY